MKDEEVVTRYTNLVSTHVVGFLLYFYSPFCRRRCGSKRGCGVLEKLALRWVRPLMMMRRGRERAGGERGGGKVVVWWGGELGTWMDGCTDGWIMAVLLLLLVSLFIRCRYENYTAIVSAKAPMPNTFDGGHVPVSYDLLPRSMDKQGGGGGRMGLIGVLQGAKIPR